MAGAALAGSGAVSVEGNRFLRDGTPWVAEGVTLVGLVAPERLLTKKAITRRRREDLGSGTIDDVRAYGADLVRYQVSQVGSIRSRNATIPPITTRWWRRSRPTRQAGFNVIVSMQWQGVAGDARAGPDMPTGATRRAWRTHRGRSGTGSRHPVRDLQRTGRQSPEREGMGALAHVDAGADRRAAQRRRAERASGPRHAVLAHLRRRAGARRPAGRPRLRAAPLPRQAQPDRGRSGTRSSATSPGPIR